MYRCVTGMWRSEVGVSFPLLWIRLQSSCLGARHALSEAGFKNVIYNAETEINRKVHCLVRPWPAHSREH